MLNELQLAQQPMWNELHLMMGDRQLAALAPYEKGGLLSSHTVAAQCASSMGWRVGECAGCQTTGRDKARCAKAVAGEFGVFWGR